MKSGIGKRGLLGIGLTAALLSSSAMGATTYTWTNTAGGRFDVSGNWNPAGTPAASDTAVFNAGSKVGRTVVTFSSSPSITNKTANLSVTRYNTTNRWEFAIGDASGSATYEAGYTKMGFGWLEYADLLISTGKLVTTQYYSGNGGRVWLTVDGPNSTWQIDDYFANNGGAELNLTVQKGATMTALAKNGGANGAGRAVHELFTKRPDAELNRIMTVRVTGTNSTLSFSGAPSEYKATGYGRFEVRDGAVATFANFALIAMDRPLNTVISNATLNTANFVITASGPAPTNMVRFVNATLVASGQVHVGEYYGWSQTTLDHSEWKLSGNLLSVGPGFGVDGTSLTLQNGSRVIATNAELRLERGIPFASVLVTGSNSLLSCKSLYVAGSSGNLLSGHKGALLAVSNGATVATATAFAIYEKGVLCLAGGTVSNGTSINVVGKLEGTGNILGSVETGLWPKGGAIRPGGSNSIGRLNIGNVLKLNSTMYAPGRLELEIGGTAPGVGYDQVSVTNGVTLAAGTVAIGALAGFKPPIGVTTFDLVTGSSISTNGVTITLPPDGDGTTWSVALVNIAGGRKALRVSSTFRPKGTELIIR
jgi:hypothetical protein